MIWLEPAHNRRKKTQMGLIPLNGAGSRTRTYEGRSREIYSLLSLPLDDSSKVRSRCSATPLYCSKPCLFCQDLLHLVCAARHIKALFSLARMFPHLKTFMTLVGEGVHAVLAQ